MCRLPANALVLLAAYAACRSRLQVASVTGFWIAACVMWIWGRWVIGFLVPGADGGSQDSRAGFFTTVFLGQFILLLVAGLLLPFNALLAGLVGVEFTLPVIVLAATTAVLIALRSGRTLGELGVVFPPLVVERQQALFAVE